VLLSAEFGAVLDAVDGFFAGMADALTAGLSTRARAGMYGDSATKNHQGATDEVINHPNAVVTHQSNGRVRYDVTEMGRTTGRNRAGGLTRDGQVIVEGPVPHTSKYVPGEVVTQYPL